MRGERVIAVAALLAALGPADGARAQPDAPPAPESELATEPAPAGEPTASGEEVPGGETDVPAEPAAPVETPAGSAEQPDPLDATLRMLDVFGDLRLRMEGDLQRENAVGEELPSRQRPRLRLRLGLRFDLNDELAVLARLLTGSPNDARSPHQTLSVNNEKLAFALDLVYLSYRPGWAPELAIEAGKVSQAFQRPPVHSELVLDADVQPTGLSVSYHNRRPSVRSGSSSPPANTSWSSGRATSMRIRASPR